METPPSTVDAAPAGPAAAAAREGAAAPVGAAAALNAVEQELGVLVRRVVHGRLVPGSGELPLDRPAYELLAELERSGPVRLGGLASALQLDVSTVSRQAAGLTARGLLDRVPDPDDRRACQHGLTPRGAELLHEVREARRAALRAAVQDWSEAELSHLAALLHRLNSATQTTATPTAAAATTATTSRTR